MLYLAWMAVSVSTLAGTWASQAHVAITAGGHTSVVRREMDHHNALQAAQGESREALFKEEVQTHMATYKGCYKNEGVNRVNKHEGKMLLSMCLLKAQFGNKAYIGMEWPQGFDAEGVAECMLLSFLPTMEKAPDSECTKELAMDVLRLGSANRLAVYSVDSTAQILPLMGCYVNEGAKRKGGHKLDKTILECLKLAREDSKSYIGMEYPEGYDREGAAQCLLLDTLPNMDGVTDNFCGGEKALNVYPLGAAHRLAVYKVPS